MTTKRTAHGLSRDPIHLAWRGILARCLNPNHAAYPSYGGRGITVCDRWRESFEAFAADMGPKPTPKHEIDRIDNNAGYSPENCRWATRSENDRNRRSTVWVEFRGERRRVADLCEEFKIPRDTLAYRLRTGWMPRTGVRRLMPHECERLQGFPDHYTLLPDQQRRAVERDYAAWYAARFPRLSPEAIERLAKDGPRAKALGNSMAVPVMRWIGQRILLVDSSRGSS